MKYAQYTLSPYTDKNPLAIMTFPELCARKVPSGHNQDLGNQPMNQQVGALYEAQGEKNT